MKSLILTKYRLQLAVSVCIAFVFSLLVLNYVFALGTTTPGFNWAGWNGGANNFTNPLNAVGADSVVCATQGTAAATQQYDNFGFTLHPSAVIHGIRVTVLGSTSTGSETWSVFLRKNASGAKSNTLTGSMTNNNACGATQQTLVFGNLTGTFGQSWSASELDDDGFTVGISLPAVGAATRRINWIKVEVNYSLPTTTTTVTSTSTVTSTFNTTVTYNSTVTSTVTSTTTLTSTFNVTSTYNTTLTTTLTSTINTTKTYNSTVTSTINVTSTFSVYNSTTTMTNTTTITVASCIACSGGSGGSMALLAVIVIGLIVVIAVAARKG